MSGAIPPRTDLPRIEHTDSSPIEHKVREPVFVKRGQPKNKVFVFSREHIAASMAPVCTPHSGPSTRGYEKRCEALRKGLKDLKPIPPMRTGNQEVDAANMQHCLKQHDWYLKIGKRACQIFQYNLKYRDYLSRQFTLANVGGEGASAEIRNEDIDTSFARKRPEF